MQSYNIESYHLDFGHKFNTVLEIPTNAKKKK